MNREDKIKIITDFMGYKIISIKDNIMQYEKVPMRAVYTDKTFDSSIDSLIPVWQKIKQIGVDFRFDEGEYSQSHHYYLIDSLGDEYSRNVDKKIYKNIFEFAFEATINAINELKKENNSEKA